MPLHSWTSSVDKWSKLPDMFTSNDSLNAFKLIERKACCQQITVNRYKSRDRTVSVSLFGEFVIKIKRPSLNLNFLVLFGQECGFNDGSKFCESKSNCCWHLKFFSWITLSYVCILFASLGNSSLLKSVKLFPVSPSLTCYFNVRDSPWDLH